MYQIETMTLSEYYTRLEAYQLREIDDQKKIALQSWFNQTVQATKGSKKNPKPKYERFDEFFDAIHEENEIKSYFDPDYQPVIESKTDKERNAAELFAKRQQEFEGLKKGG